MEQVSKLKDKSSVDMESETGILKYSNQFALLVSIVAVFWALFQLYAVGTGVFDAITLRSWHILFLLLMTYLLYPAKKKNRGLASYPGVINIICIVLSVIAFGYLIVNYNEIALRGGYLVSIDYIFGFIGVLMVFEAARRVVRSLAVIALFFILYAFLGSHIPGTFSHSGFSLSRVIDYMFWGSEGILGVAIGVSSTFVFLFILFGAFLRISGFSQFINDLSLTVAGRAPGGPAQVAVLSSASMGMINGSAIANVATTGTITIPLMKKTGFKARFAAAVEAVASTGGQFTPPIMGAAAFVMAEYLAIPYTTIVIAAIIPAMLYFLTLIMVVHFEAKKLGLKGLSRENIPNALEVLKKQGHLLIPIIVLMIILFKGFTPLYAAVFAILACILSSWFRKETRMGIKEILQALEEGAKGAVGVGVACATIGLIIGTVSLTGLGLTFGHTIMAYTNDSILFVALLVMLMSILLGMGVPGLAAYMIVATITAPVLINLGVVPLAAHMFVFIYACLSNITPPVALASYVAAGIANTNQYQVSMTAVKLGLTGFLMPFFFIFEPTLLLVKGNFIESILPALTAGIGVVALAGGLQGWLLIRSTLTESILLIIAGFSLMFPGYSTDFIGVGLLIIILIWQTIKISKNKKMESIKIEKMSI